MEKLTTYEEALDILKDNKLKLTSKRKRMVEILYDEDKYLSASDVQAKMSQDYQGISPDTIYRNLYTFYDLGIIEKTELKGEKVFRSHCDVHDHHHHFICKNCGQTREIDACPLDYFQVQLPGCEIQSHRFEVYGLCEKCNQKLNHQAS
ncbi:Fur family transcriptional regulator [Alloiococcus otitis]|uniref:Fur family transcriptional regulator n=1 Tax=Alloiococcus otitis TaxID=1652 RepID=UPI0002DF2D8F|nr:Fur family transcriptional regulator [Alloiococcus otitis]